MPKPPFLAALLLLLISSTPSPAACRSSFVCNLVNYTAGDPFSITLNLLFPDLVEGGSVQPGENYYNNYSYPFSPAYGRSSCSGSLTPGICKFCLQSTVAALIIRCSMAVGGQARIDDCGIRYEQYEFL
ncbi:antifungal protein ginkbilobin-like protein [Dendrobium catenatum]|uniref:Antifungal protein ginkbilobin-2 n=1 Tax=Dendrobium catenatum TaxID=906689 RepID=A0A2I0WY11_9ASPA|nr:antifungal protein ginkbilobin-like protein [Dendrobium catenatum]PKU80537.1 Antifungal protein ginkbilobin-2 [Dendrobium catenatum]